MTIGTNVNTIESFIGGSISINDTTRTNIAPENLLRIRLDVSLDCDILTNCIKLYDAETDGQLIGLLDRNFTGVMIRNRDFFTIDKNAIYQGDIWAIIEAGQTSYDLVVVEYIG